MTAPTVPEWLARVAERAGPTIAAGYAQSQARTCLLIATEHRARGYDDAPFLTACQQWQAIHTAILAQPPKGPQS
jgi:hypothetical protein